MEKDTPRVFISYAHEDEDVVFSVYDELCRQGLQPWIDKRDIGVGKDWDREIRQAMRKADFVVVFLSTKSVNKRGYVQREIRQALDLYKEIPEGQAFLMPVRLDKCEVPEGLGTVQHLDYTEQGAVSKFVNSIISEWASRRGLR
jgi:hypothetical protein